MWVGEIWGAGPLFEILWGTISSEYFCPYSKPETRKLLCFFCHQIVSHFIFSWSAFCLRSTLEGSWICAQRAGHGHEFHVPVFTWTQDLAFWLPVSFLVQTPPLLRVCGLQPLGCSRLIWFSGVFLFVFGWLGFLFCELLCTFKRLFVLPVYLKDLLQEDFIVKFVSKLPKLDVKISPTL